MKGEEGKWRQLKELKGRSSQLNGNERHMDEYGGIRREMKADRDKLREMRAIEGRWRQIKDNEGI